MKIREITENIDSKIPESTGLDSIPTPDPKKNPVPTKKQARVEVEKLLSEQPSNK